MHPGVYKVKREMDVVDSDLSFLEEEEKSFAQDLKIFQSSLLETVEVLNALQLELDELNRLNVKLK